MTLDNYKKGISLREKFKTLDDEAFIKLAAKSMAELFIKNIKDAEKYSGTNKLVQHRITTREKKYEKWADQVNIIELKKKL